MGTPATSVLPAYIFILHFEPRLMSVLYGILTYRDLRFSCLSGDQGSVVIHNLIKAGIATTNVFATYPVSALFGRSHIRAATLRGRETRLGGTRERY